MLLTNFMKILWIYNRSFITKDILLTSCKKETSLNPLYLKAYFIQFSV